MSAENILEVLSKYGPTDGLTEWQPSGIPLFDHVSVSPGVSALNEIAGGWLVELIASLQFVHEIRRTKRQMWEYNSSPEDGTVSLTCLDVLNGHQQVYSQPIPVTTTPHVTIQLHAFPQPSPHRLLIRLASESPPPQ